MESKANQAIISVRTIINAAKLAGDAMDILFQMREFSESEKDEKLTEAASDIFERLLSLVSSEEARAMILKRFDGKSTSIPS
jgi:DNA-directed RNA polymerase specialized sigma24 family protein